MDTSTRRQDEHRSTLGAMEGQETCGRVSLLQHPCILTAGVYTIPAIKVYVLCPDYSTAHTNLLVVNFVFIANSALFCRDLLASETYGEVA